MSTTTTNLSLVKPASNENVDLSVINGNYDKIDQFAGNVVLSADVTASSGHVTGIGQNSVSVVSATGDASDNLTSLTVDGSTFTVPSTSVGTDTDGWVDDIDGNDVFTPSDITITTDSTSGKMDSITIDNTTYSLQKISGTENASHYLTSITIDGTSSSVPQIEANPSGTATGTLSSIGINGTNYNVSSGGGGASALNDLSDVVVSSPAAGQALIYDNTSNKWQNSALPSGNLANLGDTTITTPTDGQVLTYDSTSSKWVNGAGGGGTTVVANPSGAATDELEKLQVGSTIYSLPTGGAGGFTRTALYEISGTTPESVVTLSQSIADFDLIEVVSLYGHTDGEDYKNTAVFNAAELIDSIGAARPKNWWVGNDSVYVWFYVTDDDEFTIHSASGQTGLGIWYVYGYKFGGGSGTSAVDVLWEYSDTYDITLAHPFTDYDFLVLEGNVYNNSGYKGGHIVSSTELEDIIDATKTSGVVYAFVGTIQQYANYYVTSSTGLEYKEGGARILRVWGVKIGSGGGTEVIANPSEEPTDSLSSVQIGDTVYSIEGGGSGEGWTDITGTLTAGQTSITLTSTKIKLNSVIDIYTDVFGITPQDMQVSSSSVTIKFKPQSSDVGVMIRVSSVAGVHVYDISLERIEEDAVWFYWDTAYLTVDGLNYGYCLMQKMNQTPSNWTSFGSIGIDLNRYTIPSDLSSIKVHFVKAYLQGYTAVRFMNSATLYTGGQSGNDAMLRMNGFYQWMDDTVTTGINEEDYTLEIPCVASDLTNRYLYIMAADGMIPNTTSGYNNSNEGVFDVRIDGIDFVTGGGS